MKKRPVKNYDILKAKSAYNAIGHVFCPILKKDIVFNAKGFHHLRYKPDGTPRTIKEGSESAIF